MMVLTVAACGSFNGSGDTNDEKRIVKFDSFSGEQAEEVSIELAKAFDLLLRCELQHAVLYIVENSRLFDNRND